MDFQRLTTEQRQAFDEDGYLVLPKALAAEEVEELVAAVDRLGAAFFNKPKLIGRPEFNHLDLRPGLLAEPALFKLVTHRTASLIVQLLSPNIHLHSTAIISKRPEDPNAPPFRRGWHRDIRIPRDLGHQFVPRVGIKICYCLTEFLKPASGMTLMARRTHLRTEPLVLRRGEIDPVDTEVSDLTLDAGDAFLFDNRIFHTATPNRSERTSKVLMYGYAYRWMKPEIYLENPDERALMTSDPVTRQLLGCYRDVDTPPWALQQWAERNGVRHENAPWTVEI